MVSNSKTMGGIYMRGVIQQMIMKQAMRLQEQLETVQRELEEARVEGIAGGGAVRVIASGTGEIMEVKLSPEVVNSDDIELLEDLIVVAVRDATSKAQELSTQKWQEALSQLKLPIAKLLSDL